MADRVQCRPFTGKAGELAAKANSGSAEDIDYIIAHLTSDVTLSVTRFVDYALGLVETEDGIERIEYFLFNGTQIQRNYCALFFERRDDWDLINRAFKDGLIDEIQAYAR